MSEAKDEDFEKWKFGLVIEVRRRLVVDRAGGSVILLSVGIF